MVSYSHFFESLQDYRSWKKKNVTYRGIKEIGSENESGAMLGAGLYTTPNSNKSLARTYGSLYFVINGRPENPKVFDTLNHWEIWFQGNILKKFNYEVREFNKVTTIENEMIKLGYDGVEIKGREIVNYKPKNVMYFKTENELMNWYYESKRLGIIDNELTEFLQKLPKDKKFIEFVKLYHKNLLVRDYKLGFTENELIERFCDSVAIYVKKFFEDAFVCCTASTNDRVCYHFFIKYQDKFYDGYNTKGVYRPHELHCYREEDANMVDEEVKILDPLPDIVKNTSAPNKERQEAIDNAKYLY